MNAPYLKFIIDAEQDDVFRQVCDRIHAKECVPFLGSGISIKCEHAPCFNSNCTQSACLSKDFGTRDGHTVSGMKKNIMGDAPAVTTCFNCRNVQDFVGCMCNGCHATLLERQHREHLTLGELCERFLWCREGKSPDEALRELVECLQIAEFAKLEPTPAHRCIALLVHEGLFPQIITTNYDAALEWAYVESLGKKWHPTQDQDFRGDIRVVHDQKSCVLQEAGKQGTGDCLHIFKINGCARELMKDPNYAPRILLTMKQLQHWRDRRWAKDTFRVAARSRTLLFSGFGSDEPQVIHTVHQILDEYAAFQNGERGVDASKLPPNAPVIHCFESTPSFCQQQIVNNYVGAYGGKYSKDVADQLILTSKRMYPQPAGDTLSADHFWRIVLQHVQFRMAKGILDSAAKGELAVSGLPDSAYVFSELLRKWQDKATPLRDDLLMIEGESLFQTTLSDWLAQLRYQSNRYAALNKHRNNVAELLFLLFELNVASCEVGEWKEFHGGKDLFLCLSMQDPDSDEHRVYVSGGSRLSKALSASSAQELGGVTVFVLSDSHRSDRSMLRKIRAEVTVSAGHQRQPQLLYLFTFSDLIELSSKEREKVKWRGYEDLLKSIVRSPSKWNARLRMSKRSRYGKAAA